MKFTKMHGAGNDYVYVDLWTETVADPVKMAEVVSHRHFGVGADGLILIAKPERPGFSGRMIMYNADGSRGKMCGNGLRCVAKFLFDRGRTGGTEFDLETDAGPRHATVFPGADGKAEQVRISMGAPILAPVQIPCGFSGDRAIDVPLQTPDGRTWRGTAVSMGNPHFVIFVDDVDHFPVEEVGKQIERHVLFPERVNVEFVQVLTPGHLRQRTWERGSGETWACGTGASAVAVAARLTGHAGADAEIDLLGGHLSLSWDGAEGPVFMTGGAVEVFSGDFPA